jgi:hypothetical protein
MPLVISRRVDVIKQIGDLFQLPCILSLIQRHLEIEIA